MQSTTTATEFLTLRFSDWDHTKSVTMDLPAAASVAEAVDEAKRELDLPSDVPFQALYRDEQLDGLTTLRDAGVEADGDVDLMPEVKAG